MRDEQKGKNQPGSELAEQGQKAEGSKEGTEIITDRTVLRRAAEERVQRTQAEMQVPPEDIERVLLELQVHQVELEMQNDELRRTQVELEGSRDRYAHLYNFSPVGYLTFSERGMIEEANLTAASMLGAERSGIKGTPFFRFISRDERHTFYLLLQKLLTTQTFKSCGLGMLKQDGQEFYARLECMVVEGRGADLKQIRCSLSDITELKRMEEELCIARDNLEIQVEKRTEELRQANEELKTEISERRQVEESLRKSEERFRSLVTATSQVVWTTNRRGKVTGAIPSWQAFTGQSDQDTQGFGWSEMIHPEDRPRTMEIWSQSIKSKSIYDTEYRLRRYDGEYRYMLVRGVPVMEADGSVREWVGTCTDITERKRFEQELQESAIRLRFLSARLLSAQEEERKAIARELHDSIGSSLAALKVRVSKALSPDAKGDPGSMLKSLESLSSAIEDTIDETRRIYMALRPSILDDIGVVAAIEWFCRNFSRIYTGIDILKRIELNEDKMPESLKIVIFRVMQEALNNAAKYSKAEMVNLSLIGSEDAIELRIEDNGVGFDPDMVSSARDDHRGLGLTSMRERIELSGGSLTIESTPGWGTRIQAFWPGRVIKLK